MHHSCNLEYGVQEGMERIPLKLRERLAELVVSRCHGWKYGPWWSMAKIGFYGFYGHFGVQGIDGRNWLRWVQLWFGTHLALGARWLHLLASSDEVKRGLNGLQIAYYGPRAVESVGCLNGPKRPFRPKPP
ncbi:hypothetical protein O181_087133 [Austropuccinia psidii MF-1]|uniref:Uncharacterized protein n=1 Tax=Austropuccinia psidii MF-1 TaxID=1389203 RepID=A0A9Q3IP41_9BASI|nr:hypothetical protein [Austropuccinia psidii MF-1]